MSIKELHTNDFPNINGGTKEDYNDGHELGVKLVNTLKKFSYFYIRSSPLYRLLN